MKTLELAEKKIIDVIKSHLDTLKKVEDEEVKKAITELEEAVKEYDTVLEPVVEEPVPVEPEKIEPKKVEEKSEPVAEVKEEPVQEEPKAEPVKTEPAPVVEDKAASAELSLQIASKLQEAATVIETRELELSAKNEIIGGFKNKVIELESLTSKLQEELAIYKKKEELELKKQKEKLMSGLIELYKQVGINKSYEDLEGFTTSQMLELEQALSLTVDKRVTSVRETVRNPVKQNKVSEVKKKEISKEVIFEGLFPGINNY